MGCSTLLGINNRSLLILREYKIMDENSQLFGVFYSAETADCKYITISAVVSRVVKLLLDSGFDRVRLCDPETVL